MGRYIDRKPAHSGHKLACCHDVVEPLIMSNSVPNVTHILLRQRLVAVGRGLSSGPQDPRRRAPAPSHTDGLFLASCPNCILGPRGARTVQSSSCLKLVQAANLPVSAKHHEAHTKGAATQMEICSNLFYAGHECSPQSILSNLKVYMKHEIEAKVNQFPKKYVMDPPKARLIFKELYGFPSILLEMHALPACRDLGLERLGPGERPGP